MREYRIARIKNYMDTFGIDCLLLFDTGIEIITKFPTDRIIGCGMSY